MGLTVAVTGPTGEIGKSAVRELGRAPQVDRIIGMARRPFDPADHGWRKATYRQGDVLDPDAVRGLVEGADVVVHLAFIIFGSPEETREVNLRGSRTVFQAAVDAGVRRLVYTSSVAAYGFHADNPLPLTEDVPARGTDGFYYSEQKAELERELHRITAGSGIETVVLRPCIVAGPMAPALIDQTLSAVRLGDRVPLLRRALSAVPGLTPVLPDTGVPMQLVHHDDVARAIRAAAVRADAAGVYNLAADGLITMGDVAAELGWRSVRIPRRAVATAADVIARIPMLPAQAQWISALHQSVVMDTARAKRRLAWRPRFDARATLRDMVQAARERGDLD